jgi:hypothetical protein
MAVVYGVACEGAGDGSIGGDQGSVGAEAEAIEERGGVGMAAAGGDGHGDPGGLGGEQGAPGPVADPLRKRGEEGPIHINRHQANRKVHIASLRVECLQCRSGGIRSIEG